MPSSRAVWQAFDRAASTYEQASPIQAAVAARLLEQMGDRVQPGQVWMDAGCGTGRLARALAAQGARVWAVDQAPAMLTGLEQEAQIEPLCLDLVDLPLPPGMLDGWVSSFALHWLGPSILPKLMGLLRPEGRAYVAVPVAGSLSVLQQRFEGFPVMPFAPAQDWQAQQGVEDSLAIEVRQDYADLRALLTDLRAMGGAQLGTDSRAAASKISVAQWRQWLSNRQPVALDFEVLLLRLHRPGTADDLWQRLSRRADFLDESR